MTFDDYVAFVAVYHQNHPEQRRGQAAMNVLRSLSGKEHLYTHLRWTLGINPWDDQSQLDAWLGAVRDNWDKPVDDEYDCCAADGKYVDSHGNVGHQPWCPNK